MNPNETRGTVPRNGRDDPEHLVHQLRLYIAGQSPKSVRAVEILVQVCEEYLPGRHRIELVDLLENPKSARDDDIIAVPTLVRTQPEPIIKIIGDLSDIARVLLRLQLTPATDHRP